MRYTAVKEFFIPFVLLILVLFVLVVVIANIRIVPQSKTFIIERLGGYFATWDVGLHIKLPFVDRVANRVYGDNRKTVQAEDSMTGTLCTCVAGNH